MEERLRVDWPACKAHGVCHELLPELIQLDPWGYPVLAAGPVPHHLLQYAALAVSSCPTLALRLVEPPPPPPMAREAPPGAVPSTRREARGAPVSRRSSRSARERP
jgi:ferredoxin